MIQELKGYVKIYKCIDESGLQEQIFETSNTLVYQGREALLPILLRVPNEEITPQPNWGLWWWALGSGGVLDPTDPATRVLPSPFDTQLGNHLALFDPTVPGTTPDGKYRQITNVTYLKDSVNGNFYLIAVLSLRIGKNEFNGVNISEAGLFLSNSTIPDSAIRYTLFSRVTFPAILKQDTFSLLLSWYLYV